MTVGETIKLALPINLIRGLVPELKSGRNIILPKATLPAPTPPLQPTPTPSVDQQQIILEILRKQREQEQEKSRIAAEQEAKRLQDELDRQQASLAQMKAECDDPINQWKQQILQIKSDYYVKVQDIQNKPITQNSANGAIDRLTNDTNIQIAEINNNIQQKALQCSIKYGGN